jgi:hypothetical protein
LRKPREDAARRFQVDASVLMVGTESLGAHCRRIR